MNDVKELVKLACGALEEKKAQYLAAKSNGK